MISSFVDGRIRIRAKSLKNPAVMGLAEGFAANQEGVTSVVPNLRTGSLLVEYDPARLSREQLLAAARTLGERFGITGLGDEALLAATSTSAGKDGCNCASRGLSGKKLESLALAGLLSFTLVTGFGARRLHVAAGGLFALLTAKHLYDRRRCLR